MTDTLKKLEQIIRHDTALITGNFIVKEGNTYFAFERYQIIPKKHRVTVKRYGNDMGEFTSTRTAMGWCVADKYNQLNLADDIIRLDQQRSRLRDDLEVQERMLPKFRGADYREILRLKIDTKKQLLKDTEERLNKCVGVAKYWQIRGFNDEIERTRRSASNRTSIPRD
jgi:hypothetical protein